MSGEGEAVKDLAVKRRWSLPDEDVYTVNGYTSSADEVKLDSERFKETGILSFEVTEISIGGNPIPVNRESSIYVP